MTAMTKALKSLGYKAHFATINGQGYMGGDGLACWRVYDSVGKLAIHRISAFRSPARAWAEAAYIATQTAI